jgi:hypothetical protein
MGRGPPRHRRTTRGAAAIVFPLRSRAVVFPRSAGLAGGAAKALAYAGCSDVRRAGNRASKAVRHCMSSRRADGPASRRMRQEHSGGRLHAFPSQTRIERAALRGLRTCRHGSLHTQRRQACDRQHRSSDPSARCRTTHPALRSGLSPAGTYASCRSLGGDRCSGRISARASDKRTHCSGAIISGRHDAGMPAFSSNSCAAARPSR